MLKQKKQTMTQNMTDAELVKMMHGAGVRPSVQRLAVLRYVANAHRHPSADEIYSALEGEFPTLSRTTVYNALHTLVGAGLVLELDLESGTMHYDLAPQPRHGHFMCLQCGRIYDTAMPADVMQAIAPDFEVTAVSVVFKGLCPDCRGAGRQPANELHTEETGTGTGR